ncbi:MAG: alpha/beta hydrolase fold domain-containing protein [Verrucomicrobiales bacterium]|nr:alpha/beta hydrolase fold domain-containing protein [Verrucomicrobiales bacterium]
MKTILASILLAATTLHAADTPDKLIPFKPLGDKPALQLHTFLPADHKASDKRPAIIFFFGGGWAGGTPSQFYPHCRHYADLGLVAFAAEYRTLKSHSTGPQSCVADGKSALRYLKAHATELGIDPTKIIAGGGSAGGHVAASTATITKFDDPADDTSISPVPAALVLFNPVCDNGPENGWGHAKVKAYWKDISPAHNLSATTPPTITFLGTNDKLIPVSTAERFRDTLKSHAVKTELHLYQNQGHGFFNLRNGNSEYYDKTVAAADRFLLSLALLPEKK